MSAFRVREWSRCGILIDDRITDEVPAGSVWARDGNAVMVITTERHCIVSRPWGDGDIADAIPGAREARQTDLSRWTSA